MERTELLADPYGYFPKDEVQLSPWVWVAGVAAVIFALVKLDLLGVKVEVKPYEKLLEELREEKIAAMRERGELLTEAEYQELVQQQSTTPKGMDTGGTDGSVVQQKTAAQLSAELEELIRSGKMQLPDDDMGRIMICAALTGRQRDVKQQQDFYQGLFQTYKDAFGARITGTLLMYPHCCIHILEADCHVLFDILRALSPARQAHHQVKLDQARVLQFEPGITKRSFSTWSASFMSFAKPASIGVVLETDKWVEAAKKLKAVSQQIQNVMMRTPEDQVPTVAAELKQHVPDLPDSQTVLSLAVTEEAENLELFLEYFDWDYDKLEEDAAAEQPAPIDRNNSPFAHLYPKAKSSATSVPWDSQVPAADSSARRSEKAVSEVSSNTGGQDEVVDGQPTVVPLSSSPSEASRPGASRKRLPFTAARSAELEERFSRLLRNAESMTNTSSAQGEGPADGTAQTPRNETSSPSGSSRNSRVLGESESSIRSYSNSNSSIESNDQSTPGQASSIRASMKQALAESLQKKGRVSGLSSSTPSTTSTNGKPQPEDYGRDHSADSASTAPPVSSPTELGIGGSSYGYGVSQNLSSTSSSKDGTLPPSSRPLSNTPGTMPTASPLGSNDGTRSGSAESNTSQGGDAADSESFGKLRSGSSDMQADWMSLESEKGENQVNASLGVGGTNSGNGNGLAGNAVKEVSEATATATAIPPKSHREQFEAGESNADKDRTWKGLQHVFDEDVQSGKNGKGSDAVVDVEVVPPSTNNAGR